MAYYVLFAHVNYTSRAFVCEFSFQHFPFYVSILLCTHTHTHTIRVHQNFIRFSTFSFLPLRLKICLEFMRIGHLTTTWKILFSIAFLHLLFIFAHRNSFIALGVCYCYRVYTILFSSTEAIHFISVCRSFTRGLFFLHLLFHSLKTMSTNQGAWDNCRLELSSSIYVTDCTEWSEQEVRAYISIFPSLNLYIKGLMSTTTWTYYKYCYVSPSWFNNFSSVFCFHNVCRFFFFLRLYRAPNVSAYRSRIFFSSIFISFFHIRNVFLFYVFFLPFSMFTALFHFIIGRKKKENSTWNLQKLFRILCVRNVCYFFLSAVSIFSST